MSSKTEEKKAYKMIGEKLPKNAHRNARMRKAWLSRRLEIIDDKAICSLCGVSSQKAVLQIHHTTKEAYKAENFHLYEVLSNELTFRVICKKCHLAEHRGLDLCPICKKKYKQKHFPSCFLCSGKEETTVSKILHGIYSKKSMVAALTGHGSARTE